MKTLEEALEEFDKKFHCDNHDGIRYWLPKVWQASRLATLEEVKEILNKWDARSDEASKTVDIIYLKIDTLIAETK